jgi:hypothetical protein
MLFQRRVESEARRQNNVCASKLQLRNLIAHFLRWQGVGAEHPARASADTRRKAPPIKVLDVFRRCDLDFRIPAGEGYANPASKRGGVDFMRGGASRKPCFVDGYPPLCGRLLERLKGGGRIARLRTRVSGIL